MESSINFTSVDIQRWKHFTEHGQHLMKNFMNYLNGSPLDTQACK